MKYTYSLLMIALTLSLLSSCSDSDTPDALIDSDLIDTGTVTETAAETADTLPENLDFSGEEITFFVRNDMPLAEIEVTEGSGDIVDDALYQRNLSVMERLNVTFAYEGHPCSYADRKAFASKVTQSIMAGDHAYDIVAGYSMAISSLAADGVLYNLADTAYLNFNQPWWPTNLRAQSQIGDKLYFASGDISANLLYNAYGVFFNKALLTEYQLDNPYDLVDRGEWTIDQMLTLSAGIYSDLNHNGKKDAEDRFGSAIYSVYHDAFYWGSGMTMIEQAQDGSLMLSSDLESEKMVDLITKVSGAFHNSNDNFTLEYGIYPTFHFGNTLFTFDELQYAITHLRDVEFDFGVLPVPKYDSAQKQYYNIASFPYMLYGIPVNAENPDMLSAVMEALAADSYHSVTPVLFETAMKIKYSRDDDSSRMFDIIRNSITFDFGRVFGDSLNDIYLLFRNAVTENNTNWASHFESEKSKYEKALVNLSEVLTENE